MPFALRNRLNTMQLVHPQNQRPIVWKPIGDQTGEDVQVLPDELREDIALTKAMKLGNLELLDDEGAVDQAYENQSTASQRAAQQQRQATEATIDRQSTEGIMIGLACIAPGIRPRIPCSQSVLVSAAHVRTQPPLCHVHAHLASQYTRVDGGDKPDHWVRLQQ